MKNNIYSVLTALILTQSYADKSVCLVKNQKHIGFLLELGCGSRRSNFIGRNICRPDPNTLGLTSFLPVEACASGPLLNQSFGACNVNSVHPDFNYFLTFFNDTKPTDIDNYIQLLNKWCADNDAEISSLWFTLLVISLAIILVGKQMYLLQAERRSLISNGQSERLTNYEQYIKSAIMFTFLSVFTLLATLIWVNVTLTISNPNAPTARAFNNDQNAETRIIGFVLSLGLLFMQTMFSYWEMKIQKSHSPQDIPEFSYDYANIGNAITFLGILVNLINQYPIPSFEFRLGDYNNVPIIICMLLSLGCYVTHHYKANNAQPARQPLLGV